MENVIFSMVKIHITLPGITGNSSPIIHGKSSSKMFCTPACFIAIEHFYLHYVASVSMELAVYCSGFFFSCMHIFLLSVCFKVANHDFLSC